MARRAARRWLLWLGIPVLLVALAVALFRWDWLIPIIEPRASAALGREVKLEHLHVKLGRTIVVTAEGVVVGNPEGFNDPTPFARIDRLAAAVNAWDWWRGAPLTLPWIEADRPVLNIRAMPDGSANYIFDTDGQENAGEPSEPAQQPQIGAVRIRDGEGKVILPQLRADFGLHIETEEATPQAAAEAPAATPESTLVIAENGLPLPAPPAPPVPPRQGSATADANAITPALEAEPSRIVVTAEGTYAGQPITGRLVGGGLLSLREAEKPWPVQLRLDNGPTNVSLQGTLSDPLHFQGAALQLVLAGPDMGLLTPLTGVPIPQTSAYRVAGALDYSAERIRFSDIRGTVGRSDLGGEVAVLPRRERPDVTVNLVSERVDLDDLAGFIGEAPGDKPPAKPSGQVLPDTPVNMPKLTAADVHVKYRAGSIRGGRSQPLDNLRAEFDVVDGNVDLHPISFGIGRGQMLFTGKLSPVDGGGLRADVKAQFQRIDISKLMSAAGSEGGGTLSGRAELRSTGASLAQLLGRGDGRVTLTTSGGNLSALLVDLSGLRLANAILSALGIPSRTSLQCFIADLALKDGTLDTQSMIIDTDEAIIVGDGQVNLAREQIGYRLRTQSREFTIGALSTDIRISGSFSDPSVLPEPLELGARGGAAVGLAFINPLLAILPTIQFGTDEDSGCRALANRAGSRQRR
ncbi:AsmA family protein [Roseomonas marmotae]|uniref:AsmA family protein n=1 Tax=Roseomonas marmotae TaxID=2768161 RepID=A0ABS3KEJ5_9PROT|nr:AsmA family protein [Roseomonas marmotae]MBO1075898.1 AsmA family protein [Roseomonas marmotae]QTI81919.1 AsmA family protein [Roseomonas marmotae]